ncbi:MAG TPA: DUF4118 domain-containing protein [Candidatus Limnocylindria bacterium]
MPAPRIEWRPLGETVAIAVAALAAASVGAFLLEARGGVQDASAVFLLAVAFVAYLRGSWAAVATSIGAFLTYNFLFVPPRFTFEVADAQRLLNLFLLLVVGIAIGRLTGLQRDQARRAELRERDARSLFTISRAIASAKRTTDALPVLVATLARETRMERVWIGLGGTWPQEQVVADTGGRADLPASGSHSLLRGDGEGSQPVWLRLSPPGPPGGSRGEGLSLFRLELSDGTSAIGSLWAQRDPRVGIPREEETRLLAAAGDQIGQGIGRDRLADQATELEVARRSEELKTALLDSVSHDLRTPLATIRATAGTLADPMVPIDPGKARAMALSIDAEADRLARLVGDLLDMSRISGGALRPQPEPMTLSDVVLPAVERARDRLDHRSIDVQVSGDLPPVLVDQVLAGQIVDNLLDNVARYADPEAPVRVAAVRDGDYVLLRIEDGGPGVAAEALPHLFEKFYRVPARRGAARTGTGLGLALVKGLAEAMGGTASASASDLGGLAIDISLPIAADAPQ